MHSEIYNKTRKEKGKLLITINRSYIYIDIPYSIQKNLEDSYRDLALATV